MATRLVSRDRDTAVSTPQPGNRLLTYSYDHVAESHLASLRAETQVLLGLWNVGRDTADSALLALSELYANVVTHVPGCRRCTVVLRLRGSVLELRVRDDGVTVPAIPPDPQAQLLSNEGESGRGLCLVAAFADRFWFEPVRHRSVLGKTAVVEWCAAA